MDRLSATSCIFAAAFLLAACRSPDGGAPQEAAAPPSASSALAATSSAIPADVLHKVCNAAPCGGATASVQVYRDAKGDVAKLYRLYGACVHSPGLYFDPDGTLVDTIPERPIVPGSADAVALAARHDKQTHGLVVADRVSCRDGQGSPQER